MITAAAGFMSLNHLTHEAGDDAVEGGTLVAEALLAGAEGAEVFSSLRHHIVSELQEKNNKAPRDESLVQVEKSF